MDKLSKMEPSVPVKQESHTSLDVILEHMLEEGTEVGIGQDGIVLKVDLATLPIDERHLLVEGKVISSNDELEAVAVKVLKIYNIELGDHEFKMQKRAREILSNAGNMARIPDTMVARDQQISAKTRDQFNKRGAHLGNRAEIIVMDYIDGQDIGTIMYSFVLRHMGLEESYISALSYSQKEQLVAQELGFERSDSAPERVTDDRNDEILFKYLRRKGLRLDPAIFEKVDNAIGLLNQEGIHHNDLHKQNVMLGTDGEVYIIDFGRANVEKRQDGIPDTLFSKKWKGLSTSQEEEHKRVFVEERTQAERLEDKMRSNSSQRERIDVFIQNIIKKGLRTLEGELALSQGDDSRFEQFLVMLHIARESAGVDIKTIDLFIASLEDKRLRPFEINKLHRLQQSGYLM